MGHSCDSLEGSKSSSVRLSHSLHFVRKSKVQIVHRACLRWWPPRARTGSWAEVDRSRPMDRPSFLPVEMELRAV